MIVYKMLLNWAAVGKRFPNLWSLSLCITPCSFNVNIEKDVQVGLLQVLC